MESQIAEFTQVNDMNGSQRHNSLYFWIGIAGFILTVLFVNPLRETVIGDDYAYSLTVKHLLETGKYQLHDWVSANILFQAYWGSFLCRLFGYSFSSLRISTLILALLGIISFYFLAREHNLDSVPAALLMMCLFASPIELYLTFSFMTDVPFVSCLIVALLFYSCALRLQSNSLMLSGSVVASAAILIRQPGMAIPAGLFLLWLSGKERLRRLRFFFAGLALPAAAGIWQIAMTLRAPNYGAKYRVLIQSMYWESKASALLSTMFWRCTATLHYLALFTFPLLFMFLLASFLEARKKRASAAPKESGSTVPHAWILLTAVIVAGILVGHSKGIASYFMPYLPWFFAALQFHLVVRIFVTIITFIGAIVLARILIQRYTLSRDFKTASSSQRLLDFVTLFLLLSVFLFAQLGDRYILVFLPFTLIAIGRSMAGWLDRFRIATVIACFTMLLASALWSRGQLAHAEALWEGCERVRSAGVETRLISGPWTWVSYYEYSDYLKDIGYKVSSDVIYDFFFRWLPERQKHVQFQVDDLSPAPPEKWRVVAEIPFRGILLRERRVYVYERIP